jgi:hypothetical protein
MQARLNLLRVTATIVVLATLASLGTVWWGVVVIGQYWLTAPVLNNIFVIILGPLWALYCAYEATRFIWKKSPK